MLLFVILANLWAQWATLEDAIRARRDAIPVKLVAILPGRLAIPVDEQVYSTTGADGGMPNFALMLFQNSYLWG